MESLGSLNPLASSIKYIIEYDLGDGVHYIPLPYNPTSIRFTKQFATTVTPTLGKIPVIEHSGPRIVDVEIEGLASRSADKHLTASGGHLTTFSTVTGHL